MSPYSGLLKQLAAYGHRQPDLLARRTITADFAPFMRGASSRIQALRAEAVEAEVRGHLTHASRILDIGSGLGVMTQLLALLGHRALGVEKDPRLLKSAKNLAAEERLSAMFLAGDAENLEAILPLIEDSLGGKPQLVFLGDLLHVLESPQRMLSTLRDWLPAGSALVISERNPESRWFRWTRPFSRDPYRERYKRPAEWNALLSAHGFVIHLSIREMERGHVVWSAKRE